MATRATIDADRIVHLDGRPFFLIGARHMPEGATPELLREAGFNAFRTLAFGTESGLPEEIPPHLEGIYFWLYVFDRADFAKSADHQRQLRAAVRGVKAHPGLLCYENLNEPALYYPERSLKADPKGLARGTGRLRELDPNHPVWMAHACGNTVQTLQRFNACADILGANPYPIYVPGMRRHIGVRADGRMLDCPDQSIHAVGRYTEKMMQVGRGKAAVWMLIQAMANEHWYNPVHTPRYAGQGIDESKVLYPTYEQMRFMVFDAVVHGATGVAFSMHRTPTQGQIWRDVRRLVGELKELHDALCAPPVAQPMQIEHCDLGFTAWGGVRALARRLGGDVYLFAVNTQFDPAEVTIRMPALGSAKTASLVHEGCEAPVEQGALSCRFQPYGVHVFRIEVS